MILILTPFKALGVLNLPLIHISSRCVLDACTQSAKKILAFSLFSPGRNCESPREHDILQSNLILSMLYISSSLNSFAKD